MSRSVRAETRSRAKDDIKRVMNAVEKGEKVGNHWRYHHENLQMGAYIEFRKEKVSNANKSDKENSQKGTPTPPQITPYAGLTAEDSNTCFSMVSDSQGATEFVSSMPFSEDSNSQGSEGPVKRLKTSD